MEVRTKSFNWLDRALELAIEIDELKTAIKSINKEKEDYIVKKHKEGIKIDFEKIPSKSSLPSDPTAMTAIEVVLIYAETLKALKNDLSNAEDELETYKLWIPGSLSQKHKKVIKHFYFQAMSEKEVALKTGYCVRHVRRIKEQAVQFIIGR